MEIEKLEDQIEENQSKITPLEDESIIINDKLKEEEIINKKLLKKNQ